MKSFTWAASLASLALVACGSNTIPTGTTGGGSGTTTGGSGTTTGAPLDYPVPVSPQVYGTAANNTFPNISLNGGAILNFNTTETLDCPTKDICTQANLSSPFTFQQLYFQSKAPPVGNNFRYAFIDISGAWCPHCQQEATDLPKGYVTNWLAKGGMVFSVLVQDYDSSLPCSTATLFDWITQYQINYPMSIDSEENMSLGSSLKAWPGNVIIRLHDMHVMESVLGAGDSFYNDFSTALTKCENDPTLANDCYAGSTCQNGTCVANTP